MKRLAVLLCLMLVCPAVAEDNPYIRPVPGAAGAAVDPVGVWGWARQNPGKAITALLSAVGLGLVAHNNAEALGFGGGSGGSNTGDGVVVQLHNVDVVHDITVVRDGSVTNPTVIRK